MPHVDANGQRIHYEEHGQGEPLVCVMGLGGDINAWLPLIPRFSAGRRLIVFDNRDVGQSSMCVDEYEVSDMAADALGLADALELGSFDLLGMSLGGAISQHVALTAPDRVRTLTLVVTYAGGGPAARERARILAATAMETTPEEHARRMLFAVMNEAFYEDERAVEALLKIILSNPFLQPAEAFARQARAAGRHDVRERIAELAMPVHVIGAERDMLVPVWKSEELAALIPGSTLTILPGAPHAVNLTHTDALADAVLGFLDDRSAARIPAASATEASAER